MADHARFLAEALKEALKAQDKDEVPVGAVLVKDGKILARGHNIRETSRDPLGHAELVAVRKAVRKLESWRLIDCDLYVTLEPCVMCAAALVQARVRHVYYGVPDPKAGAVSLNFGLHQSSALNHRYGMSCLDEKNCGTVLTEFFRKKRKKKK